MAGVIRKLYNNVDWVKKKSLPENTMYFCAQYRQEYPAKKGKDYVVLDAEGKGYYVGTVYSVRTRSPSWFGEGDEKIYIDGEAKPSIRGTGTEDYFLSAWGLKLNSTPYFGVPYLNQSDRIVGQMTCSYRWHVHDPLESDGQLLFKPESREEGWIEYSFEVKEKEPLRLLLELTRSYDFGVWQPILNGVKLGEPIDLYRPQPDLWEFHIMDFWPDPGEYTLRLECVGKNSESSGHCIGVNSIRLRERRPRVKAFGYDKDKDWRQEQILYD